MKAWRHIFLYVATLPWDLVAWVIILFIRVMWGNKLLIESPAWRVAATKQPGGPVLAVDLAVSSWPTRTWYKGWGATTLGHAIFYAPGMRAPGKAPWRSVQVHEHVHVEQFEASMLRSLAIGATVVLVGQSTAAVWLGFSIWFTGFLQMVVVGWVTALLRGEDAYTGSEIEEAAYAVERSYEEAGVNKLPASPPDKRGGGNG